MAVILIKTIELVAEIDETFFNEKYLLAYVLELQNLRNKL